MNKMFRTEYERTRELVQNPDWYLEFGKMRRARMLGLGAVQAAFSGNVSEAVDYAKQQMIDIFERLLSEHEVRLGIPGEDELDNQDEGREPVSQVVIHHSSRAEGISLGQLNALHLLRLYVPRYQEKSRPVLNSQGGYQPIYSGHFNGDGDQVFYGYHWKVQQDGSVERLLADEAIGWHAGNWAINTRSVGICIDDDLEHTRPSEEALDAVAAILKTHYPNISPGDQTVIGHNEAMDTVCPGNEFLKGWKGELLNRAAR